jgi:hypothetical protein
LAQRGLVDGLIVVLLGVVFWGLFFDGLMIVLFAVD